MFDLKEWISKVTNWINNKNYSGFGATVNLESSYTSKAGAYTIPSDGIIRLQCRYTSTNYVGVTVCNADGTNEFAVQICGGGSGNHMTAFPVFKGMKAWTSANNGSYNYVEFHAYI